MSNNKFTLGYLEALDDLMFYISIVKSHKGFRFLWEDEIIRMIKFRKSNVLKSREVIKLQDYGWDRIKQELGTSSND